MTAITLYRPVGTAELKLIENSGWRAFPPRLPEQPIFYPVTKEAYARQIARDWNARHNDDHKGFVTRFAVRADFLSAYPPKVVGGRETRSIGFRRKTWMPSTLPLRAQSR